MVSREGRLRFFMEKMKDDSIKTTARGMFDSGFLGEGRLRGAGKYTNL
jgi:hypothetical protein